jgi:hypothetical protein
MLKSAAVSTHFDEAILAWKFGELTGSAGTAIVQKRKYLKNHERF